MLGAYHIFTHKHHIPLEIPIFSGEIPMFDDETATKLLKRAAHVTIWERCSAGGLPAARHSVHDRMIEWIELKPISWWGILGIQVPS
jgi:hypothetical protein